MLLLLCGCGMLDGPLAIQQGGEQSIEEAPATPEERTVPSTGGAPDRPPACPADPVELVRAAYAPYLANEQPVPLDRAACWSTSTLAVIRGALDRAEASGTAPLGFDPLIDAQEFEIDAVLVERVDQNLLVARFSNFSTAHAVYWTLTTEEGHPRVDDLHTDRWHLLERLDH